jgi:hypothetical protein
MMRPYSNMAAQLACKEFAACPASYLPTTKSTCSRLWGVSRDSRCLNQGKTNEVWQSGHLRQRCQSTGTLPAFGFDIAALHHEAL